MDLPTSPFSLSLFLIFVQLSFGAASEKPKSSRPPCGGSANLSRGHEVEGAPHTSACLATRAFYFFSFYAQ